MMSLDGKEIVESQWGVVIFGCFVSKVGRVNTVTETRDIFIVNEVGSIREIASVAPSARFVPKNFPAVEKIRDGKNHKIMGFEENIKSWSRQMDEADSWNTSWGSWRD